MNELQNNKGIPVLLSKAKMGILTDRERERLTEWAEQSPENKKTLRGIMDGGNFERSRRLFEQTDTTAAFRNVTRRTARRKLTRRISAVSTAAAVIAMAMLLINRQSETVRQNEPVITFGSTRAELILSDEQVIQIDSSNQNALLSIEGIHLQSEESEEIKYKTLRINRGGEITVMLADGTLVFLNAESELRFPEKFVEAERKVYLTGEAYFQVAHDPENPFVIEVGNSSAVRVLGTSFNLRSYPSENKTIATLVEGSIRYETSTGHYMMIPGEQIVEEMDGEIVRRAVETKYYTSWKDGEFAFSKRTLREIMEDICRWYDLDIVWKEEHLKDIVFTGNIPRYDTLNKVVKILEMTGHVQFGIEDESIIVSR